MTTVLAKPCHLCGTTLRPIVNRQTKRRSDVWACEHCDLPCPGNGRCVDCNQVLKAMR